MSVTSYQRACGIDVAKDTLEVCVLSGDQTFTLSTANTPEGFTRIIQLCQKHQVELVVLEATGGLQRPVALAMVEAQIPVAVVNPSRIRHYALAEGLMAKNDKVDARIIALYVLKIAPAPTAIRSQQQETLARLVARKDQLIRCKVAEQNRLQQESDPWVLQSITRHLRCIAKEITQADERLDRIVQADPVLQLKAQTADQAKGIGRASAVALVVSMPELGTLTRKQVGALAGLAPFDRDSGKVRGERHIFGGRSTVRTTLYMCTLTAIRCEPKIKSFYERLLAAGKCKMKAITACMHKLLIIVNAQVRDALARLPQQAKEVAVAAAGGSPSLPSAAGRR